MERIRNSSTVRLGNADRKRNTEMWALIGDNIKPNHNLASCYGDDDRLLCSVLDGRFMVGLKDCGRIRNVCVL